MSYAFVLEEKGVLLRFEGDFSDEVLEAKKRVIEHPDFPLFDYKILDLREVYAFTISQDVVRKVAAMDVANHARNPNLKVAVVCSDLLMKGLTRMYEAQAQSIDSTATWVVEVFDNESDARKWVAGSHG